MGNSAKARATYDDLIVAPDHLIAEIVGGELLTRRYFGPIDGAALTALHYRLRHHTSIRGNRRHPWFGCGLRSTSTAMSLCPSLACGISLMFGISKTGASSTSHRDGRSNTQRRGQISSVIKNAAACLPPPVFRSFGGWTACPGHFKRSRTGNAKVGATWRPSAAMIVYLRHLSQRSSCHLAMCTDTGAIRWLPQDNSETE